MRFVVAFAALWLMAFLADTSGRPAGERREKLYPGTCPDKQSWYLVDSDDFSVTVGCYDPDYQQPN